MNRLWALLFLSMPILAICVYVASALDIGMFAGTWLPRPMSQHARDVDHLFILIHVIAAITLALTGGILFVALYRSAGTGNPRYVSGHSVLEIAWTVIPAIILVVLAIYQSGTWNSSKIDVPGDGEVFARVVARQYEWEFFYPGADGQLGTADDIRSVNHLVVPINQTILLRMESEDVIHSFSVPQMRLKQDIVPGRVHSIWFNPNQLGSIEILCAELCGWGHYTMRARLDVVGESEFTSWLEQQRAGQEMETREESD